MTRNRFKVGTFNVYNLISANVAYYGNKKYKPEVYDKKVQWIGAQIDRMNADLVGFQEVWRGRICVCVQ
jgi:hypothetical protein